MPRCLEKKEKIQASKFTIVVDVELWSRSRRGGGGGHYPTAPVAGYEVEDLRECIEAIYDMHENLLVRPGCAQMMKAWELTSRLSYSLPPPYMLTGMS
ncbi:unnamed protein product [Urochloa humidicola]